jgi:acyl carrier protein
VSDPAITEPIRNFILQEFLPGERPDALKLDTPLVTGGILDSIATLKLISFLEERFDIGRCARGGRGLHGHDRVARSARGVQEEVVLEVRLLHKSLAASAKRRPDAIAVEDLDGGSIAYQALDMLSDCLRDRLAAWGVRGGDRVGFWLPKSIDSVATLFGILKTGAAYVPVDPGAPPLRGAYVLNDCAVSAIVVEQGFVAGLEAELAKLGAKTPRLLVLNGVGGGRPLARALDDAEAREPAAKTATVRPAPDEPAYILYTSGSTGKPKGVTLCIVTRRRSWTGTEALSPKETDRFSSHAPFHFDLSILDLHVPAKHGATVVPVRRRGRQGTDAAGRRDRGEAHHDGTPRRRSSRSSCSTGTGEVRLGGAACRELRGRSLSVKHLRALQKLGRTRAT